MGCRRLLFSAFPRGYAQHLLNQDEETQTAAEAAVRAAALATVQA